MSALGLALVEWLAGQTRVAARRLDQQALRSLGEVVEDGESQGAALLKVSPKP